jgi:hypothetical protein
MIDAKVLLADLARLLKRLEDDLRERVLGSASEMPAMRVELQGEWQSARDASRISEPFESWVEQVITQAAVHWLLSCVFIRFIEDNDLVERPWLSGTPLSGRLALARDRHDAYFRAYPHQNDRDYLVACFREASALPGLRTFFDEAHNPVFRLGVSGDAAMALVQFWQDVAADSGTLAHDFTDTAWNTRFLGDLYQDLSEATRKRYALLQTPEFVEEFILDRTLTPAIRTVGFREASLIDPTCGSGHFLLGAFRRLVAEWQRQEPGRNARDIAQKALDAVAGVDLNPFAVAIARFRLLLAALKVADVQHLTDAPDFKINVAIGDSLLHGARFGLKHTAAMFDDAAHYAGTGLAHAYASEDLQEVNRILGRQYHAVVGNPPYIVVKDAALNAAYRARYASCHRQYSLGCPFTERFFELAVTGNGVAQPAGYTGLITANSFMKREFGSKLIEQVLPQLDLSHVIDTSGAYIPGHGTPTVMLLGRHQVPLEGSPVRTVMGIKGEPAAPDDPARGLVWSAIVEQIDQVGSESEFISVADTPREVFRRHPWSIGGGGAGEVKELIEADRSTLADITTDLGFACITKADDVFVMPRAAALRGGCESSALRPFGIGEEVRDWSITDDSVCLFPYESNAELLPDSSLHGMLRFIWPCRTALLDRKVFGGQTYREAGKAWYSYGQIPVERFKIKPAITFAFIATHNHFAFDRDGRVFNRTAPVVKLRAGSSEDEHLRLLGLLNSSVASFWMKHTFFDRGNGGIGGGIAAEEWERFYEFASTLLKTFPLPSSCSTQLSHRIDNFGYHAGRHDARCTTGGCW